MQIALRNPVIERIREEYGERERQRIMDRVLNQRRHRNEIQGDQLEGSLFNPVSKFTMLKQFRSRRCPRTSSQIFPVTSPRLRRTLRR